MIKRSHGGYRGKGKVIDFSANINPLGLSSKAREAITKSFSSITRYPEQCSEGLKKALADFHRTETGSLAIGTGSMELIYLIPKALNAKKVLIITPTFSEYEFAARSHGAKVRFHNTKEKDGFRINIDRIKRYLPGIDLVFLCNPNNPTGSCLSYKDLKALVCMCRRHNATLAIDEAFVDFVEGRGKNNLIKIAVGTKGVIIIRSITKFFAMPGLRIGYAVGHSGLIKKITDLQYPWNVNSIAQAAGKAALEDSCYISKSAKYALKERDRLFCGLDKIKGIKVFPPSSNFVLCKLEADALSAAKTLNKRLIKKGVVVRDCDNFRGLNKRFFRVAVKRREENARLVTAIKEVLSA
jgi:threonine-phosphate decarboxylase